MSLRLGSIKQDPAEGYALANPEAKPPIQLTSKSGKPEAYRGVLRQSRDPLRNFDGVADVWPIVRRNRE